jgi:hypothetical protein
MAAVSINLIQLRVLRDVYRVFFDQTIEVASVETGNRILWI